MEQKDIVTATADGDNFSASWVDASDYHGKGYSQVDEKQMVSVRFPDFLFCDVFQMLWNTYLVFAGVQDLKQVVTLLWTFKLPWNWAYHGTLFHPGVAQFAFGFYSVMLTSTVLGLITMVLYKPRSWCVYCPMGTMTQLICKVKDKKDG